MKEFNLFTALCKLGDRDLELIFMHLPGPCTPRLPVALKEPVSQGGGWGGGRRRLKKKEKEPHARKGQRG